MLKFAWCSLPLVALSVLPAPRAHSASFGRGEECANCNVVVEKVVLCEAHLAEEHRVFREQRDNLTDRDEAARIAALEACAGTTHAHVNAPSERVALLLAKSLKDPSYAVRVRATQLMVSPQNAIVCLDELLRALPRVIKAEDVLRKKASKLHRKFLKAEPGKAKNGIKERLEPVRAEVKALADWHQVVFDTLLLYSDERVIHALLEHRAPSNIFRTRVEETIVEALLRLGSQTAVKAIIRTIDEWEKELGRLRRHPRTALEDLEFKAHEAHGTVLSLRLRALLAEAGKDVELIGDLLPLRDWLTLNLGLFPEKLPGVTSPVYSTSSR